MSTVSARTPKLRGDEVVRHAQEASDATLRVLIQPNLPQRRVSLPRTNLGDAGGHWSSRGLAVGSPSGEVQETVEQTACFLRELLHGDVAWIESARTFAAEVTPDELRQIAEYPGVKAVWCNRDVQLR